MIKNEMTMNRFSSILMTALCAVLGFTQVQAQASKSFAKDGLRYTVLEGQNVSVAYNDEDSLFLSGRVVIPAQVVNPADQVSYNVVALADTAFKGCDLIESIVLPSSLKSVGSNIVDNCFNLKSFDVAAGSAYSVADGILFSADGTELVCCPPAKGGDYTLPAGVKKLAPAAFSSCKNFRTITLPEGLKDIPAYAFYECWGLNNVKFPKSLETIGDYAFDGTILQFLVFDRNLKSIGDHAFDRSSMVECICLGSKPATLGAQAFGDEMMYTRLYVPAGFSAKYKQAGWGVFPTIYQGSKTRRWAGSYR